MIDAHVHLWDPATRAYPWMAGPSFAPVRHRYGQVELEEHLTTIGASSAVLVQSAGDLRETAELLAVGSALMGRVAGVVGWLDLTMPERLAESVSELRELPGGELLCGMRHQVEDESEPDFLLRPEVLESLRLIGELGLAYDVLVNRAQWHTVASTARSCPSTRFVLDHAGKPPISEGYEALAPWREMLESAAAEPNIWCKLSGLVTQTDWPDWGPTDLVPVVGTAIEAFGPARVIVASDWPFCEIASTALVAWNAIEAGLTWRMTDTELSRLRGGNACEAYGL